LILHPDTGIFYQEILTKPEKYEEFVKI